MTAKGRNSLLIDTSFFIALAKPADHHHVHAKKLAKKYSKQEWVTTWPVITELSHLLVAHSFELLLEEQLKGLFHIFSLSEEHLPAIIDLMKKYSDHEIDLADLSLIILAQHLSTGRILSFDQRDFSFLRWHDTKCFENLTQK